MKKTFSKKLTLKKSDIASLSENEMKGVQGGSYTQTNVGCPPIASVGCYIGPATGVICNTNATRGASTLPVC